MRCKLLDDCDKHAVEELDCECASYARHVLSMVHVVDWAPCLVSNEGKTCKDVVSLNTGDDPS